MPRTKFYGHSNVQVTIQPNIGLDAACRQGVVEILSIILADETVLSIKMRRANEASGGTNPSDPHPVYEAQCKQINAFRAEIIERISILGGLRPGDSELLIDSARLTGRFSSVPDRLILLADHEAFIRFLREDAQKCSEIFEDHGTFSLLVSILRYHEKMAWVLRSGITQEQSNHEK